MSKTLFQANKEELEVRMERIFDAPREHVWKVYTDPVAVPQWWGPRALTTTVEKMEVKPGGVWRIIQKDDKGEEFAFHGEYREVQPPQRLMQTFIYEGFPDQVLVESIIFEELQEGKTKATSLSEFPSIEALEGMISTGMEEGAVESWERLAEYLENV
jgi:uncharacterized protein YndB with AHSA1/START domain